MKKDSVINQFDYQLRSPALKAIGYTYAEIGDLLDMSADTAESHCRKFKEKYHLKKNACCCCIAKALDIIHPTLIDKLVLEHYPHLGEDEDDEEE